MKLKRIGALFTALALALSMTAAATEPGEEDWFFTDIANHWARNEIQAMYEAGLASGYQNDSDDTYYFAPERTMSAAESILFCTRIAGIDDKTQAAIYENLGAAVKDRMPANIASWAAPEISVAVELGILSLNELEDLNQTAPTSVNSSAGPTPYLAWNIPREQVCMYLVRAMQLEPLAKSLPVELCTSYLNTYFVDADEIAPMYHPYIYILRNYNIFMGESSEEGFKASPKSNLKRCQMMALVCRAIEFMEEKGLFAEAAEYTTYPWSAGTIEDASSNPDSTITLTLSNEIMGEEAYTLPSDVVVYDEYNMRGSTGDLTNGLYARLIRDEENGEIHSVRLCGQLNRLEGQVVAYTDRTVTLRLEGRIRTLSFSRFTQFKAGENSGDVTVLDPQAGYTTAVCYLDSKDTLVGLELAGGTVQRTGIISAVAVNANGTTLTLTADDGINTSYIIPTDAEITVNQAAGTLSPSQMGRPVILRVGESDSKVFSVSVDTLTLYYQGPIINQGGSSSARTVSIRNALDNNKDVTATLAPSAVITYDGQERTTNQIETGWFATAKVVGGMITELTGFSATAKVEGIISNITYGADVTTLYVEQADGGVQTYALDMNNLPDITREGKNSSLAQLRKGDALTVTLRYHKVELLEAKAREADLTGEILEINQGQAGMTVKVKLTDGSENTYSVSNNVSVTKDNKALTYRDLSYGDRIAFIANGTDLVSVEILSTTAAAGETTITGQVLSVDTRGSNRLIFLLLPGNDEPREINVKDAAIQDLNGRTISLISNSLKAGDTLTVFGEWNGTTFVAKMVIRTATASN